jgi:hypothetical protein
MQTKEKKENRYKDVPIYVVSKNTGQDCSIIMRKVYEIILNSKG